MDYRTAVFWDWIVRCECEHLVGGNIINTAILPCFLFTIQKTGLFDKLRFNFADMPCRRLVRAVIFWGNVFERFESFDKIAKIVKTAIVGDLRDGKIAAQKFSRGAFDTICH